MPPTQFARSCRTERVSLTAVTAPALQPVSGPRPRDEASALAPVTPIHRAATTPPTAKTPVPQPPEVAAEIGPAIHPTLITRVALFAVEVLDGVRSVTQLSSVATEQVTEELRCVALARAEQRAVTRDHRRSVPHPGKHVTSCRPFPGIIEASVTMHTEVRSFAVALRLEHESHRNRWRVTSITVL